MLLRATRLGPLFPACPDLGGGDGVVGNVGPRWFHNHGEGPY